MVRVEVRIDRRADSFATEYPGQITRVVTQHVIHTVASA